MKLLGPKPGKKGGAYHNCVLAGCDVDMDAETITVAKLKAAGKTDEEIAAWNQLRESRTG